MAAHNRHFATAKERELQNEAVTRSEWFVLGHSVGKPILLLVYGIETPSAKGPNTNKVEFLTLQVHLVPLAIGIEENILKERRTAVQRRFRS